MAGSNNSDDSNRAPENFHLSSSNDGTDISLGQSAKCPLCLNQAKLFYCRDCLANGDFHSKKNWSNERFAEKKIQWLNQQSNSKTMEIKCGHLMQRNNRVDGLRTRIKLKEQRVTLLRKQIADIRGRMESGKKELAALSQRNKELQRTLPRYGYKVRELDDYVTNKLGALKKQWADHVTVRAELKHLIRSSINRLIRFIFPIERSVREAPGGQSTAKELAEATHTAYIRGKWVLQDSLGEVQHTIVAPHLPGNGDYSAYSDWVATHKDGVPATSDRDAPLDHNPAFRISAALTYTAQLVQVLSYYLDVRLPFRMNYSDFCSSYMNEGSFNRRVTRLNANIFFLCYTQRVRLSELNPMHTIENIQILLQLEHSDLGWMGHVEPTNTPTKSVESLLKSGLECDNDSESEDENSFPYEWEAVPHLSSLDVASPTPIVPTAQNPLQTASLVTSAAASIASLWRGWTTGK
ncbi:beclin 1-associated autophagy-related key regulator [Phlebotomus argentipes]|uniref:beclin 1-associated autophagy-related key regulator n=1 Tax=Phlebotomus argentipes TaxID=94469 RepID=UPI00289373FF|nr:beclin 1-associated autophagy-related key regulator [Phlebotomus argentipes]